MGVLDGITLPNRRDESACVEAYIAPTKQDMHAMILRLLFAYPHMINLRVHDADAIVFHIFTLTPISLLISLFT